MSRPVRNIAIIAHVDHGKTTLVDALLRFSGAFARNEGQQERALDRMDLERERGITILAKCTGLIWRHTKINVVDTPGHADFGGEVERVLRMVDSVLLVIDACEGPQPQTRFVTDKALRLHLRPIVVVNKIDRPQANPELAINRTFDLLVNLHATDEQLDFPIVYTSAIAGTSTVDLSTPGQTMGPLLDLIVDKAPPPPAAKAEQIGIQVATLEHDDYLGYLAVGRIASGKIVDNQSCLLLRQYGEPERFRVTRIVTFLGLGRQIVSAAETGDIVGVAGMTELAVGDTITDPEQPVTLEPINVEPPTVRIQMMVDDGPFSGTEGTYSTTRHLRARLVKELKVNIALSVKDTASPDVFDVIGRGELHLSVLIETMRREGYEFCISKPRVVQRVDNGLVLEPYEKAWFELDQLYSGPVIESVGRRRGRVIDIQTLESGRSQIEAIIPTRGLIGYRTQFLTETRGTGIMNWLFHEWGPPAGEIRGRSSGAIIAQDHGPTVPYALFSIQERGELIVGPGVEVYAGQVIGFHSRGSDLIVNPSKTKKLTNIRSAANDENVLLTPPRQLSLEEMMSLINDDEWIEVTPMAIRIRKRQLDHSLRKREQRDDA